LLPDFSASLARIDYRSQSTHHFFSANTIKKFQNGTVLAPKKRDRFTEKGRTTMERPYQARWISKKHMDSLRKTGQLTNSVLLESEKGHIIVEPANSHHGDGGVLAPDVADYELRPAWCRSPNTKVRKARELLGLAAVFA
jgi:hypothetical protein